MQPSKGSGSLKEPSKDPNETYHAYEKFLRKKQHKQAYNCLNELLTMFPDDEFLVKKMIALTFTEMQSYELARGWLYKMISLSQTWIYYVMLSYCELV
ncbi:hypothetical protein MBAV_001184, partial [Candidatus Magnetobacterium bavaricum]